MSAPSAAVATDATIPTAQVVGTKAESNTMKAIAGAVDRLVTSAVHGFDTVFDALSHLDDPLSASELNLINQYWRASNYLTIGQIYLRENPLLTEPLKVEHIKPRLLGHWGTSPGINLLYVHMNRLIKQLDIDAIMMVGPGHGGPAIVAQVYLEGTYTEIYPEITRDTAGMRQLFRQFSAPGGIPSHCSPNVPGSIHEGGELGYVLTHAFGAVMDNPSLITLAIVGDGEAETGPLEGSWKGISFINPVHDGAVLPVLHLNGYKISGPTVLGRESDANIRKMMEGHGYECLFVEGHEPALVHQQMAKVLEYALKKIRSIQVEARAKGVCTVRPKWPMIVMRTPKGWTGPKFVDGKKVEGSFRSHQVPLSGVRDNAAHFAMLEEWLRSYKVEELFDADGRLKPEIAVLAPTGNKRMSAQPATNGGANSMPLNIPALEQYEMQVDRPASDMRCSVFPLGNLCRDLYKENPHSFRIFCPDETNSNRLGAVFETQKRAFMGAIEDHDEAIGTDGRVMEVLSEHNVAGWQEGYTLTGRHGLLATYEAFSMIFNSMTLQSIKWMEVVSPYGSEGGLKWRKPTPSLNIFLTSTCWRNDHNGFSHQGPSFVDTIITKHGSVANVYFPVDGNSLLAVAETCFRSDSRVNLIVQDKQPQLQYHSLAESKKHLEAGCNIWQWASTSPVGEKPDVVLACCGDVMTMEALAAAAFLREFAPEFKVRFVNVINLMSMFIPFSHPHGLTDEKFNEVFTADVDVAFAYHAYAGAIHQVCHHRANVGRFHVRGYGEFGTTTTPFMMCILNKVSRYHLVQLVLSRTKNPPANAAELDAKCADMIAKCEKYAFEEMEDMKEVSNWTWKF